MNKLTVAIDIDGVLANFRKSAKQIHETHNLQWIEAEEWNATDKKFWGLIDGPCFWENLEPYPHADKLLEIVQKHTSHYFFLTKSSWDDRCAEGKARWMRKHFPDELNRLWVVRGSKGFAARKNSVLIDDRTINIQDWVGFGGIGFKWKEDMSDKEAFAYLIQLDNFLKSCSR